jgi:hypothetical protein
MMDSIENMRGRHARFEYTVGRIRAAGTDSLSHFGNGYVHEGGYSLQQNPDEFAALSWLLWERCRGLPYLEIGSASGGALRFLHERCDFSWLGSMDNHGHHRWLEQDSNWGHIHVNTFVGDSHGEEARMQLAAWVRTLRQPLATAFVDGDHSYEGVTQDIVLVRECLAPGSLLVLHDIVACDGVKRAWQEAASWAKPIAAYVGAERPLGIGVLEVL